MAIRTAFSLEHVTTGGGAWITGVGIGRRFERKEVCGEREQELVGHPVENLALRIGQDAVGSEIRAVATRDQRRIAHHIRRPTEQMGASVINVLAILDADEIRYLRHVVGAAVEARKRSWRD